MDRRVRLVICDPVFDSTDTVTAELERSMAQVRPTHLGLGPLPGMDPDVTSRFLQRFAAEVAPALRSKANGTTPLSG